MASQLSQPRSRGLVALDHPTAESRMFTRAPEQVPVHIFIKTRNKELDAWVHSTDISFSGVFFASTFFFKLGTVLEVEFQVPTDQRTVRVKGVVVRESRWADGQVPGPQPRSGFAVRFVEYDGDAKTILAALFLKQDLAQFLDRYVASHPQRPHAERAALEAAIVAWEIEKIDTVRRQLLEETEPRAADKSVPAAAV